jgi:isocitrate lyase
MSTYQPNKFRVYSKQDVARLKGSFDIEYTLAKMGANRLWQLFNTQPYVKALGALTGNQAVQQVKAGLDAVYLSGWQVAADANLAGQMYPDQSLYPANSVPNVVKKVNSALMRADQIEHSEGGTQRYWMAPIIADAEAGFGGPLNSFELMKAMIEAGAAGVHFEDQLSSEKKCGHMGGKVLVPMSHFIKSLVAARLAADICGTDTIIVARTDADSAKLLTSNIDEKDLPFILSDIRTEEGFYKIKSGMEYCVARGLAFAPYADMLWMETSTPDIGQAKEFAQEIHKQFPNKLLMYNCSPSFNWKKNLTESQIASFQDELGSFGYKFQFVTLAGFHALNHSMFSLSKNYREQGMTAYAALQEQEFENVAAGYTAVKHQHEVGASYFDEVSKLVSGGSSATVALEGSTEEKQF